jgi:hypothetical protein
LVVFVVEIKVLLNDTVKVLVEVKAKIEIIVYV